MNRKTCIACESSKPKAEFYRDQTSTDGLRGSCKECMKSAARANRARKLDYYLEYDRERATRENRIAARLAYQATPHGRRAVNESKRQWRDRNTIKMAANIQVARAVKDGRLVRPGACEDCAGGAKLHGHHDDYAAPLSVRWLCAKCHRAWHRLNGCGANG